MATVQVRPMIEQALAQSGAPRSTLQQYDREISAVADRVQSHLDRAVDRLFYAGQRQGIRRSDVEVALEQAGLWTADGAPVRLTPGGPPVADDVPEERAEREPSALLDSLAEFVDAVTDMIRGRR